MKKTLLTALLGVGLVFGSGNEVKGQESEYYDPPFKSFYIDKDKDEFNERINYIKEGEKYLDLGFANVLYTDEDKTKIYESIKLINYNIYLNPPNTSYLSPVEVLALQKKLTKLSLLLIDSTNVNIVKHHCVVEQIKINENTGLIDYLFEEYYPLDYKDENEIISGSKFNSPKFGETIDIYDNPQERKYYTGLTEEKIYNISPEFRDRVKNLIISAKDEIKAENFLNQEKYFWKKKTDDIHGNMEEEINRLNKELEYKLSITNQEIIARLEKKFGTKQQAGLVLLCYIGECSSDKKNKWFIKRYAQFEKSFIKNIKEALAPEQFEYLNAIKRH